MHFMMASGRPSGKLRLVAHTMQGLLVIPPDITTPRPQEPPKELELPEQASASLVQPAASASPEEPSAEEQQTLGRPSDPNRLPLTSAVERSKASQVPPVAVDVCTDSCTAGHAMFKDVLAVSGARRVMHPRTVLLMHAV